MVQGKSGPFRISICARGGLFSLFPGVGSITASGEAFGPLACIRSPHLGIFRTGLCCLVPTFSSPRAGSVQGGNTPTGPPATQSVSVTASSRQPQGPQESPLLASCPRCGGPRREVFTAPGSSWAQLPTRSTGVKV